MKPFAKWMVWATSVGTVLTGLVYWWMDHMMEPVDEWAVINHPLQPWVLKAHILVAPALVFAVGLIAMDHIWKHFRNSVRMGRRTGVTTMMVVGPMIVSGYLIQAVTQAAWLEALGWIHVGTGVVFGVGIGLHQLATRRRS